LTATRSKPAVPLQANTDLWTFLFPIVLIQGSEECLCLHNLISASLNKHIKNTYHFSAFSSAFVDIIAAEQTPDNPTWFQGTADAVRQSLRHIEQNEFDYVLICLVTNYTRWILRLMVDNHISSNAEITIATIPVTPARCH
jgi:glucose-1-phosphate adenylyltransferase